MDWLTKEYQAAEVGLFLLVGLANTAIDFAVYNALARPPLRWGRVPANLVSTTAAMSFSFTVNLLVVFAPQHQLLLTRTTRFLVVSLFALYVLQNLIIHAASHWPGPARLVQATARRVRALDVLSDDFIQRNTVKGFATVASLAWNFFWYKHYVYAN